MTLRKCRWLQSPRCAAIAPAARPRLRTKTAGSSPGRRRSPTVTRIMCRCTLSMWASSPCRGGYLVQWTSNTGNTTLSIRRSLRSMPMLRATRCRHVVQKAPHILRLHASQSGALETLAATKCRGRRFVACRWRLALRPVGSRRWGRPRCQPCLVAEWQLAWLRRGPLSAMCLGGEGRRLEGGVVFLAFPFLMPRRRLSRRRCCGWCVSSRRWGWRRRWHCSVAACQLSWLRRVP